MADQLHESFAIHPGLWLLEEIVKPYNLNVSSTADHLRVKRSDLSRLLNGRAALTPEMAGDLYRDLRNQTIRMLCSDVIHGDLSPYNILMAWNGPNIIDFPQVVNAAANSRAEFFFKRDLENLRRFFAAMDPSLNGRAGDAHGQAA